jgi:hypothetical protein
MNQKKASATFFMPGEIHGSGVKIVTAVELMSLFINPHHVPPLAWARRLSPQ